SRYLHLSRLDHSGDPSDPPSCPTRRSSDLPPGRSSPISIPVSPTRSRRSIPSGSPVPPRCWKGTRPPTRHRLTRCCGVARSSVRSEEHTSELQSRFDLVCRLLLEKKNALQC